MFKNNELKYIINCLDYNISHLESSLDKYKGYLSKQEIKSKIQQLQNLKLLQIKTECIISNEALEKIEG